MVGEAGRAGGTRGRARGGGQQGDSRWLFARDDGWRLVLEVEAGVGAGEHVFFSSAESRGA